MQYWDDMNSKWGFGDGDAIPPDAEQRREIYVRVLNLLAQKHGSQVRCIAWNRPGVHNYCLIWAVTLEKFQTLTPDQILAKEDITELDDEPSDDGWLDAIEEAGELELDNYIITETRILPEYHTLLEELEGKITTPPERSL